jgi:hypothetical protein
MASFPVLVCATEILNNEKVRKTIPNKMVFPVKR